MFNTKKSKRDGEKSKKYITGVFVANILILRLVWKMCIINDHLFSCILSANFSSMDTSVITPHKSKIIKLFHAMTSATFNTAI